MRKTAALALAAALLLGGCRGEEKPADLAGEIVGIESQSVLLQCSQVPGGQLRLYLADNCELSFGLEEGQQVQVWTEQPWQEGTPPEAVAIRLQLAP